MSFKLYMINNTLINYFLLYLYNAHPETDLKNLIFAVSILLSYFFCKVPFSHPFKSVRKLNVSETA